MGGSDQGFNAQGWLKKLIAAAIKLLYDPRAERVREWGCSQCKGPEYASQDEFREARNCTGDGPRLYLEFDSNIKQCPWSQLDTEVQLWVVQWQQYEQWGVLPFGGTDLMAYPAQYLEAFSACSTAKNECQNDAHKARQLDQERQAARAKLKRG